MGCWNGTCTISNLPIGCGDRVKLLFLWGDNLVPTPGGNNPIGTCHPDTVWSVIPLVVSGEYNDYGSIESVDENAFTKTTIEIFKKMSKSGTIKIEDCDWDKNKEFSNIEEFAKLVERGRVSIKHLYNHKLKDHVPFAFCMILESVWNSVCKSYVPSMWVKDRPYPATDQFAHRIECRQHLEFSLMNARDEQLAKEKGITKKLYSSPSDEALEKSLNKLSKAKIKKLVAEQNQLWTMYDIMHSLRKTFMPQSGSGSQDSEYDLHIALANTILGVCNAEKKKYEED